MIRKTLSASLLALAATAPFAHAFEAGDIIVRAGAITVDPHNSDNIHIGHATTPYKATLDSDTQLGLNFAYMLTNHIGVELLAATPFKHDIGTKGMGGLKLGETKQLPPTLSVVYYPLDSKTAFQPYVGLGVNYTWFYDNKLSSDAEQAGLRGLDLKDSWGVAAQIGADYMLTDHFLLNAQVRYIDIDTTATSHTLSGQKVRADVNVDPWVYMVGIGYKF